MISVVIAIKNDITHVSKCFNSLVNQTFPDYEVIFVDGKSSDGTSEFLRQSITGLKNFKLIDNPAGNAASGRNLGIKCAEGIFIAFIDSDAYTDTGWLERIQAKLSNLRDPKIAGVGGPILPPDNQPPLAHTIHAVMSSPIASGGLFNPSSQHKKYGKNCLVKMIPTGNIALKRKIFEDEGLFDETFVKGQDLEFFTRLFKKGYRFLYDPEIKVWHPEKTNIRSFARQVFKWGAAKALTVKKHGFNAVYFLPLAVLFAMLFLLILSLVLPRVFTYIQAIVSAYALIIVLESIHISLKRPQNLWTTIVLFPLIHSAYTAGFFHGLTQKIRKKI